MRTSVHLRTARAADFGTIADYWMEMFEEVGKHKRGDFRPDWRERFVQYFTKQSEAGDAEYIIAVDEERIVGTAGAIVRDGYPAVIHGVPAGYILGVFVRPEYRSRGIATDLTRRAITFLKRRGVQQIRLHASPFGRPIYEKLGFVATNEMQLEAR
jgi:ribosomal protein S18 acetylase RimI-like enzyme